MGGWHAIEPFLLTLSREGRAAFLREHPESVLIFKPPDRASDEEMTDTHTLTSSRVELASKLTEEEMKRLGWAEGYRVMTIVAAGFARDDNAVRLGRSKACDLVMRHATVSKEHALFRIGDRGVINLRDLGSRNGTRLNGAKLQTDWEPTLESGDRITFGNVTVTYQTADAFCDFLSVVLEGR